MLKTYRHPADFALECGAVLHGIDIAYHTFGDRKSTRLNSSH